MKGVFTTRISPAYDDEPAQRYHFPRTYLNQAANTVGDFIVYYEPGRTGGVSDRRDGSQSYFAVARVKELTEDRKTPEHFYALIDETTYLGFDRKVPFLENAETYERKLMKADGSLNKGAFRRAVRNLSDEEFATILNAGFSTDLPDFVPDNAASPPRGFADDEELFRRPIIELVTSRPFRDRAFSRQVRTIYDRTCSLTGLKILNGHGRPEVQAAHIKPVADGGPDSVRNGIALSSTLHWMFDRGLVSLEDDGKILVARKCVPDNISSMLNRSGYAVLPDEPALRPARHYLRHHRETVFKG